MSAGTRATRRVSIPSSARAVVRTNVYQVVTSAEPTLFGTMQEGQPGEAVVVTLDDGTEVIVLRRDLTVEAA